MVRTVVGLLLIAHGLVHLLYLMPRPEDDQSYPFVPETRWSDVWFAHLPSSLFD